MQRINDSEGRQNARAEYKSFVFEAKIGKLIPEDATGFEPKTKDTVLALRNLTLRIEQALLVEDEARRNQLINPILEIARNKPTDKDDPITISAITVARIALKLNGLT